MIKSYNGFTFFHLVARFGSKDSIADVLKWAEQNDTQLGILTDPVTGNDKELNGLVFFHLVGKYGSKDSIEAALTINYAGENNALTENIYSPVKKAVADVLDRE